MSKKLALEHTGKTTAAGHPKYTFCARTNSPLPVVGMNMYMLYSEKEATHLHTAYGLLTLWQS